MTVTMNSDILHTNHRRIDTAFKSAANARKQGARTVIIEWQPRGQFASAQYAFEQTADGVYARLRGCHTSEAVMRIHHLALKHGLPFSCTASWARTDGTPVTQGYELLETSTLKGSK